MPIDERWDDLTDEDWLQFAERWIKQIRLGVQDGEEDFRGPATMLSFTARPEQQWKFIVAAVDFAETDQELGMKAAGPLEHIMANHGETYITQAEHRAAVNSKFARAITGIWRHGMTDELWSRVQEIQQRTPPPL